MKVTSILVDFACWSTVACVRNVALSETKLLRFFWFLVFVAMVVAFVAQLVMIILKYIAFPADVSTAIVFSSQPFPDVTFCNYNPFKWSVVEKNPDFNDIHRMLVEYRDADEGISFTDEFGFQGLSRFERQDRANDLLVFLAAQLTDGQKEPALYHLEELVTECLFAGETCDPNLIEEVPDPVYGRCFVYKGANQTITRSGLAHGLRLILTANLADSFTFVSDFLPTTLRVGVRMTINEENSLVSLENHGFNVGVGFQTSIAIAKSRTERMQEPYGICVNEMAEGTNYYDDLPYTIDSCFTSCLQRKIVERCGCAHPMYRKAANDTLCTTPEDATCIATHRGSQYNGNQTNLSPIGDCGCRPPCRESYFSSTLSVLMYPAFGYTVGVGTTDQLIDLKKDQEEKANATTTTGIPTTKTTRTSTTRTSTIPSVPPITTPPTPLPTTVKTTTKTTTSACPDYTTDPKYQTLINYKVNGQTVFKTYPSQSNPCMPVFECNPQYADKWWTCWPCYYECPGYRLPTNPYTTPNINCRDYFAFAKFATGWGTSGTDLARPDWDDWNDNKNAPPAGCNAERDKMATSTSTTTTVASTTTTAPSTTTVAGWVTDCDAMKTLMQQSSSGYYVLPITSNGKPYMYSSVTTSNWFNNWPCSYKCADSTRFPTNATVPNVKCVDFFNCFKINTDKFTNKPTFDDWDEGGTGNDDCAAMQNVGGGGIGGGGMSDNGGGGGSPWGRKKRSTNTNTTTVKSMGMPGKGSCESWNSNFKSVEDCQAWYKKNGMIVNVYYETLEYQVLTESAAYSLSAAVNDLGGQAGLWLGLSVVSIVECIGLFFMILLFCITGKRLAMRPERERRPMPDLEKVKPVY